MEETNFVKFQWQNVFLICFKLGYFCSGHKSFSYFPYFQHWKVQPCLSRSAQNMCRKFGRWWDLETLRSEMKRPAAMWCQRAWRAEVKKGSAFALLFVQRATGTLFFSSIVMLELMYTHFQQTNAKDSRLMASNLFLNVFFKIILTHGYTWLHMCKPSFGFVLHV